jgi:hypothetical protein
MTFTPVCNVLIDSDSAGRQILTAWIAKTSASCGAAQAMDTVVGLAFERLTTRS